MNMENKRRRRICINRTNLPKRLLSFCLCIVLTLTYSNMYTLAISENTREDSKKNIVAFSSLPNDIQKQEILQGEDLSAVIFPNTLEVSVEETVLANKNIVDKNNKSNDEAIPKKEPDEDNLREIMQEETEISAKVNENETVELDKDNTSVEEIAETSKDNTEEPAKNSDEAERVKETELKNIILQDVRWEIDEENSSKPSFSSKNAGDSFVFEPAIPEQYRITDDAELPKIRVSIRDKETVKTALFYRQSNVQYYDRDEREIKTVPAEVVTDDMKTWGEAGAKKWYVVNDKVTINTRIMVTSDVHLILADGAELKATQGIDVSAENALTIYGQTDEVTQNTGKIDANGVSMSGIGGTYGKPCGKITITGGIVDATSIYNGAGIGGGQDGAGGNITISGGKVTAKSKYGAGIGGGAGITTGAFVEGGNITITGGTVTAKSESGAGIGGGTDFSDGLAHGDTTGGTVTINGGTVTAKSMTGAGIGGGANGKGANITISGGTVTASSGGGAGIGGGLNEAGETTDISGGTVTASSINGAGIGGGDKGAGGNITISGGTVTALVYSYGSGNGAGIGGGCSSDGGNITISGGTVIASTAGDGAGIGGGGADRRIKDAGAGGNVAISGGTVFANSKFSHGIGGGISKESGGQNGANGSFDTGTDGKAIIRTKSFADKDGQGSWQGIIFEKNNGNVYGNQELTEDFEINAGQTLTVPAGITLTISSGKTLIIKGKVRNFGTINGDVKIVENGKLLVPYPAPNVVIDYRAEKLTGFNKDNSYEITPSGANVETIDKPADGKVDINTAWIGKNLSIMAKEDDSHLDGIIQKLDIPNHPEAPVGLKGVSETSFDKNDGKITGTTAGMEYKPSSENNWKPCTAGETLNLAPGEYEVRMAASDSNFVGKVAIIKVKHAAQFTAPKAKTGLSYTGENQELIERGTVETAIGELQYSLEEAGAYSTAIPKATDAGTYKVYYKVTGVNPDYDYSLSKGEVTVNIAKANQAPLSINDVTGKKYGNDEFVLATTGGSGTGVTTYSVPVNNGVLSIDGSTAKIIGVGEVTVTAVKAGDKNYNKTSAELKITIAKGDAPVINFPTASNLIYGQKLSQSVLTGGSTGYGSFAWKDGNVIPTVNNSTGYEVVFTPSEKTLKNYEAITEENKKKNVLVTVAKANPTINLTANVSGNSGSKAVTLIVEVAGPSGTVKPTGNVKFSYKNGGSFTELGTVSLVDGKATYKWDNPEEKEYEIRANYVGDTNYNAIESAVEKIDTRKQSQSDILFTAISDKTYGDGEFTLSITGGSGTGAVTYSVPRGNGVLEITGNKAKIIGAGSTTVTVKKAADDNYNEASRSTSIIVAKKKLTVKADDKTVVKGKAMSEFTYNKAEVDKNLADGDTFANPVITSNATNTNHTGEYDITISGGTLINTAAADVAKNYEIKYKKGILKIVEALYEVNVVDGTGSGKYSEGQTVTIKANDKSGYTFTIWKGSDGVVFANASAKETSFIMPTKAVTVTANYSANSNGGQSGGGSSSGGGGGGGGSSSSPKTNTTPAIIPSNKNTQTTKKADTVTVNEEEVVKSAPNLNFVDLKSNHWAIEYIRFVVQRGVMVGVSKYRFDPNGKLSRAMLISMLARISGDKVKDYKAVEGIPQNKWYSKNMNWAVNVGILQKPEKGKFNPNEALTRSEMAVIIGKYLEYKGIKLEERKKEINFKDSNKIPKNSRKYVEMLAKYEIVVGDKMGKFNPDASLTRAETAVVMAKLIRKEN